MAGPNARKNLQGTKARNPKASTVACVRRYARYTTPPMIGDYSSGCNISDAHLASVKNLPRRSLAFKHSPPLS
jgi:hypothetical protein